MPYKVWAVNEILTAADMNDYVGNQTILSFAGTAARATAIGTPVEGMLSYVGSGVVEVYAGTATGWAEISGGGGVTVGTAEPAGAEQGDLWLNSTEAKMYVYYDDGDSEQWVAAVGGTVPQQGKIVAVESVLKTDIFSASVAAGANTAITDLSITYEVADPANKLLITGFTGVLSASGNQGDVGIAVYDGSSLLAVGDAAGSRTSITAGGRPSDSGSTLLGISPSFTFLHTPGAGSKTYTLRVINTSSGTQTIYVNRTERNDDAAFVRRGASALTIQEVAG